MQPLGFLVDHNPEKWGMVGQFFCSIGCMETYSKHQFGFGTR